MRKANTMVGFNKESKENINNPSLESQSPKLIPRKFSRVDELLEISTYQPNQEILRQTQNLDALVKN